MKINNQYPKLPVQDKSGVKGAEKETASNTRTESKANLEVTTKVNQDFTTNKMRSKIDNLPDVNMAKVKALKAQIKKGEYQIDTGKLADNLLKDSIFEDI